jgi:hypothetical protein
MMIWSGIHLPSVGGERIYQMTRHFVRCIICLTVLGFCTTATAREFLVRAQCFDDTGDRPFVEVVEFWDIRTQTRRLVGFVNFANGDELGYWPLHFREAGTNVIWRGEEFMLRVSLRDPSEADRYVGRFHGRDDTGEPIIPLDLSCTVLLPAP